MDTSSVVFVCGIISCVIGVASFVTGMVTRARNDGKLEAKLEFCLQGIEEIKANMQGVINTQGTHDIGITECKTEIIHTNERIDRIEKEFDELRKKVYNLEK